MKRRFRLTALARADVIGAARWYKNVRKELARRFLDQVDAAILLAGERPGSFPIIRRDMRRVRLATFPYGVFFIEEGPDIIVLGVIDLRRNPRVWRDRRR